MRKSLVAVLTFSMVACSQLHPRGSLAEGPSAAADAEEGEAALPEQGELKGRILERIDAAPYSYLKLSTASGEVWAAVPQTAAATGSEVTVVQAFPMEDFESRTLNRKFDVVYFGTLGSGKAAAPLVAAHGGPPPLPAGHPAIPGTGSQAAAPRAAAADPGALGKIEVAKASGPDARTVAEIYAQRSELNEKTVAVQGQVVKFNAGVMGRNWVHLRDGSGNAAGPDNDVTVTTQDVVAVGDVVTAKGTVRLEKDFGAGYAYPVIIEDAKVAK